MEITTVDQIIESLCISLQVPSEDTEIIAGGYAGPLRAAIIRDMLKLGKEQSLLEKVTGRNKYTSIDGVFEKIFADIEKATDKPIDNRDHLLGVAYGMCKDAYKRREASKAKLAEGETPSRYW